MLSLSKHCKQSPTLDKLNMTPPLIILLTVLGAPITKSFCHAELALRQAQGDTL
jgi:hypothetical protein